MPVEEPQFGEVWTTTDLGSGRLMQGIVADVSPTRVLFVSLTGNRVSAPLSRLRTNWNFVQGAPKRTLPPCERMGCTAGGMIEYDRADRVLRTCPRHAPFGVQCRITTNYTVPAGVGAERHIRAGFECRSTPCPTCGDRDPAEDVRIAIFPARLWFCSSCGARWVTIPRISEEEQNIEQIALMIAHELGRLYYEVDSILVLHPDSWNDMRRSATAHMEQSAVEAIPRLVVGNMQASLNTTAVTVEVREFFHAIARVRANVSRPVDRPVQRLGGSPNRGGVVGSTQNPVRPAPVPDAMLYRPTGTGEAMAEAMHQLRRADQQTRAEAIWEAASASADATIAETSVEKESVWVQRASGDLMVVLDFIKAQDGSDAISFRRSAAEDIEPAVTMTRRDFLMHHRPFITAAEVEASPTKPPIEVTIDEEWECQDGSGMIVTQVDFRREFVYGEDLKTKRRRQIPFTQFMAGRWRKIVRRSIYDRLRKPEISLNSSGSDDD